jgi:hypothetical protein
MALAVTVGTVTPASTGPVTGTLPSHATNDLLLFFGYQRASATALTVTTATGWTAISSTGDATNGAMGVWYKKAASGAETNPVCTGVTTANATMIVFTMKVTGQDQTTPIDVAAASATYAAPSTPFDLAATAAVTTTTNNAWPFIMYGSGDDNTWVNQTGGWTGDVVNATGASALGTDASIAIVHREMTASGSSGTNVIRQTVNGGDVARSISFAIRSADQSLGGLDWRSLQNSKIIQSSALHRASRW